MADHRSQRRLRARGARCAQGRAPRARGGGSRTGGARLLAEPLPARAFGRHAATRRPRARVRDRCRNPADGRALLGPRSPDPRAPAGRVARVAADAAPDHPVREPRPRRGAQDRHTDRHHGGRAHHPGRPAGADRHRACGRVRASVRRQREPAQRVARSLADAAARVAPQRGRNSLARRRIGHVLPAGRRRAARGALPGRGARATGALPRGSRPRRARQWRDRCRQPGDDHAHRARGAPRDRAGDAAARRQGPADRRDRGRRAAGGAGAPGRGTEALARCGFGRDGGRRRGRCAPPEGKG